MLRKSGVQLAAWAVGTTAIAATMVIATALPAAAQDRYATAWGNTSAQAVANANNFCVNTLHGKLGGHGWGEKDGSRGEIGRAHV